MTPLIENYEQAIEFLFRRINYERITGAAYSVDDFRLDRTRELLARLDNPHEKIPAVHVAGTKGKGSTAAMIAAALTAAGYRTGLFTSPHISAFEERMAVDGVLPTPGGIVELVNSVLDAVTALDKTPGEMSPTYFEIATAMAWLYFLRQGVHVAVLEVGLGGRLDATNLCRPEVTVITTISRDHTRQLGSRLDQIAGEKAGIVKPGVPLVTGVTAREALMAIEAVCRERGAPIDRLGIEFTHRYRPADSVVPTGRAGDGGHSREGDGGHSPPYTPAGEVDVWTAGQEWTNVPVPLVGEHQARNAAVAVAALARLAQRGWGVPMEALRSGLARVHWPGRIEVLRREPTVIVDAAHNWAAIEALLQTLDDRFPARRRVLVFAATRDKDVSGMLRQLLPRFDSVILTCYQNNPRAVRVEELVRMAGDLSDAPFHWAPDPASAWKLAQRFAGPADLICITGSFFVAAELRELILDDGRQGQRSKSSLALSEKPCR